VIVQNVAPNGMAVLNAADPIVAGMADNTKGDVTYFAADASLPVMQKHRAQGRRIVYVDKGHLVARQGKQEERVPLAEVPITRGGVIGFQVENVMASVAAAWAVGIPWDAIRLGLKTFVGESDNAPGRFNVFDYRGATVIADYGHNPDAIQALVNGRRDHAGPAPLGRDQRRGRPPRRGHPRPDPHPGQGVRRRAAVRRPVPARPPRGRSRRPAARGSDRRAAHQHMSTRSRANSSPSTARWNACNRATCR
jgi:hypothetical protein